MKSITAEGVIDTFLLLLIGMGPKLALLPFLQVTAPLDLKTKARVQHKMLTTASIVAVVLVIFGELLRGLLHFSVGSLSIAGGIILLVIAVGMVLSGSGATNHQTEGKDPMQLAQTPLAVPYLLNPVGIVALMTISAEAQSVSTVLVELAVLGTVLLIDFAVFHWATQVSHNLKEDRMVVIEKVFGFLIAAISVQLVLDGLVSTGVIGPIKH